MDNDTTSKAGIRGLSLCDYFARWDPRIEKITEPGVLEKKVILELSKKVSRIVKRMLCFVYLTKIGKYKIHHSKLCN